LNALIISLTRLNVAVVVDDLVLKLNCSSANILLLIKCWYILTYKTFLKTLENASKSDIGLWLDISLLSPFLNISLITAYFSLAGNISE
jgi:hypothetical protein